MGRHSIPGPDDFAAEPSDAFSDEPRYTVPGDEPDSGFDSAHQSPYHAQYQDFDPAEDAGPDEDEDDAEAVAAPRSRIRIGAERRRIGEWRGGHRSEGGRRGVSIGVISALVAVVVVVATVILWRFFGHTLAHRNDAAAGRCVEGGVTVAVIADPSIAEQVTAFAQRYNKSAKPVGDRCVEVSVKAAGSDAVVRGFIGDWPAELGERPALWIPGSSVSAARLRAATGRETISDSHSLVTSPVLLAVRPELKQALGKQNWGTLPELQTNPDSLAGLNLRGWGSLRLALPMSGNADAAFLAAEAVAAAAAPHGAPATAGSGAVRTLADAQPDLSDDSITEAMNVLLRTGDRATAPVHAVATTEQQLFARAKTLSDASGELSSWRPPGPAAVADYPTVQLSGSWLSREQISGASEFARFAHKPDQLADLAEAGFRVEGVSPPHSDVIGFDAVDSVLSVGDDDVRATLADALTAPATGSVVTVMLDQSMGTEDNPGKTRLANVVTALNDRIKALPGSSSVGLWAFDGSDGRSLVTTGPLGDQLGEQPRSAAVAATLDGLPLSGGGAVSFTTLRLVYSEALANFHEGQNNSVLVITSGPHTDRTLDGPGLQDYIRGAADPQRPVAVSVLDFGADPDRATWEAVAQISGGSYQNLPTSALPALTAALSNLLS